MSAIDHATNGLFDNGATTKWKRGSNVEVIWRGTQHGGRLEVFKLLPSYVSCWVHTFILYLLSLLLLKVDMHTVSATFHRKASLASLSSVFKMGIWTLQDLTIGLQIYLREISGIGKLLYGPTIPLDIHGAKSWNCQIMMLMIGHWKT